ncbi:predicted protein [Streptomyces viridosporus ATCC 14672]|uniref:Predicted protein n=1 Tax=Streptomyces viridosporus (strain ATCC 14672 / DSM 40746 / JCM 4963 / KCTC 9882 / NRRL B-12104 / FH 1290) TaxID=566461 RepID=D6A705_STRV1|nr:predicted protein [Streptomyces viridosporus ATCC 14672]
MLVRLPHVVPGTRQGECHGRPVPADGLGQADHVRDDSGSIGPVEHSATPVCAPPPPMELSHTESVSCAVERPLRSNPHNLLQRRWGSSASAIMPLVRPNVTRRLSHGEVRLRVRAVRRVRGRPSDRRPDT